MKQKTWWHIFQKQSVISGDEEEDFVDGRDKTNMCNFKAKMVKHDDRTLVKRQHL